MPDHAGCSGCGSSCWGWKVRPHEDEVARVTTEAAKHRIPNPVVSDENGPYLRRKPDGSCALLNKKGLCTIYAHRPSICAQWPLLATETEEGVRLAVDPACTTAVLRAPPTPEGVSWAGRSHLETKGRTLERRLSEDLSRPFAEAFMTVVGPDRVALRRALQKTPPPEWIQGPPLMVAAVTQMLKELYLEGLPSEEVEFFVRRAIPDFIRVRMPEPFSGPLPLAAGMLVGANLASHGTPTTWLWGFRFAAWNRWIRTPPAARWWMDVLRG